jgi:hypothetical protein
VVEEEEEMVDLEEEVVVHLSPVCQLIWVVEGQERRSSLMIKSRCNGNGGGSGGLIINMRTTS